MSDLISVTGNKDMPTAKGESNSVVAPERNTGMEEAPRGVWIKTVDRLPVAADGGNTGDVIIWTRADRLDVQNWQFVSRNPEACKAWMAPFLSVPSASVPEQPKPEAGKEELLAVLRATLSDLTCREDDAHYCPNCDNSLFNAKARLEKALSGEPKSASCNRSEQG